MKGVFRNHMTDLKLSQLLYELINWYFNWFNFIYMEAPKWCTNE